MAKCMVGKKGKSGRKGYGGVVGVSLSLTLEEQGIMHFLGKKYDLCNSRIVGTALRKWKIQLDEQHQQTIQEEVNEVFGDLKEAEK